MKINITSIGEMRERVVIEKNTPSKDAVGQMVPNWATYKTVWARAEVLSGRELELAQKIAAEVSVYFTVRYRTDFDETMRGNWRGNKWNIHTILPADTKDYMVLAVSRTN